MFETGLKTVSFAENFLKFLKETLSPLPNWKFSNFWHFPTCSGFVYLQIQQI